MPARHPSQLGSRRSSEVAFVKTKPEFDANTHALKVALEMPFVVHAKPAAMRINQADPLIDMRIIVVNAGFGQPRISLGMVRQRPPDTQASDAAKNYWRDQVVDPITLGFGFKLIFDGLLMGLPQRTTVLLLLPLYRPWLLEHIEDWAARYDCAVWFTDYAATTAAPIYRATKRHAVRLDRIPFALELLTMQVGEAVIMETPHVAYVRSAVEAVTSRYNCRYDFFVERSPVGDTRVPGQPEGLDVPVDKPVGNDPAPGPAHRPNRRGRKSEPTIYSGYSRVTVSRNA